MKIKTILQLSIVLVGIILIFGIEWQCNKINELKHELHNATGKTDTVYKNRYYKQEVIKKVYIEKPVTVIVYKPDTNLRKAVEDTDIVIHTYYEKGGLFRPAKLVVDKITPKGFVYSNSYNAGDLKSLEIDNTGNVSITRKRKRFILKIGIPIAVIGTGGYIIYKSKILSKK
jgi:hypothetical protein